MGLESVVLGDRRWMADVSGAVGRNYLQEVTGAILPALQESHAQLFAPNPLGAYRSFYRFTGSRFTLSIQRLFSLFAKQ